jgi:hypothetical protein
MSEMPEYFERLKNLISTEFKVDKWVLDKELTYFFYKEGIQSRTDELGSLIDEANDICEALSDSLSSIENATNRMRRFLKTKETNK